MIEIAVTESFWAPVRVEIPLDHGHKKVSTFKVKYKRLNQDELDDLNKRIKEGVASDANVIDEVMLGWADVADAQKNPLEFNPENLAALLLINPSRTQIVKTFFDTVYRSARGN